jgi:hypothetical protein
MLSMDTIKSAAGRATTNPISSLCTPVLQRTFRCGNGYEFLEGRYGPKVLALDLLLCTTRLLYNPFSGSFRTDHESCS